MSAALEYAQQLVNLRSASDFIKLSSTHARIQIELMIKQPPKSWWNNNNYEPPKSAWSSQ